MKVRDMIKALKTDGWEEAWQKSSHRTFKKEDTEKNVAVNGQDSQDASHVV